MAGTAKWYAPPGVLLSGQEVYDKLGRRGVDKGWVPKEQIRREKKEGKEAEALCLARKEVLAKKPKERHQWLKKAAEQLSKIDRSDRDAIYEILSSRGFPDKITPGIAKRMLDALHPHLPHFSTRQIQFLQSEKFELVPLAQREEEVESRKRAASEEGDGKRAGIERRIDPADGSAYSLEEFAQEYGGSVEAPPPQWRDAAHSAFVFRS